MQKVIKTWTEYFAFLQEFFDGRQEVASRFFEITEYLFGLRDDLVVRTKNNIIGISKTDEQYRFYVSVKRDCYSINIKSEQATIDFISTPYDELIRKIDECNELFSINREKFLRNTKRKSSTGVIIFRRPPVVMKSTQTPSKEELFPYNLLLTICFTKTAPSPISEDFWEQFGEDLEPKVDELINSLKSKREIKVILERFRDKKTLETIGTELGITRERIRQIQVKAIKELKGKSKNGELLKHNNKGANLFNSSTNSFSRSPHEASLFTPSPNASAAKCSEEVLFKIIDNIYNGLGIGCTSDELDMPQEMIAVLLEKRTIYDDRLSCELHGNKEYELLLEKTDCLYGAEASRNYARWSEEEDRALLLEWNSNMSICEIASYHQRKKTAVISRYKRIRRVQVTTNPFAGLVNG